MLLLNCAQGHTCTGFYVPGDILSLNTIISIKNVVMLNNCNYTKSANMRIPRTLYIHVQLMKHNHSSRTIHSVQYLHKHLKGQYVIMNDLEDHVQNV